MTPLAACLDIMDRPWQWGMADCCASACAVFHALYGVDPMREYRGSYGDRPGANRFMSEFGGIDGTAEAFAEWAGLREIAVPEAGAIGIAVTRGGADVFGICVGDNWAVKSRHGFATTPFWRRAWIV